jgi:LacI family transcriptional regulator
MTSPFVRIGLVLEHSLSFYRQILRGVNHFATQRPQWLFTPIACNVRALQLVRPLSCDGYIAHIFHPALGNALQKLRRPVINVSGVLPELPFPRVVADHAEVGRQAARHLLECGLRQLGFVGYRRHHFAIERERGFREIAEAAEVSVAAFHQPGERWKDPSGVWRWNERLLEWLRQLPKPVGVLASHDTQGAQIAEYCQQLNLTVPDDVAVVGVDDDDLLCDLSRPSLSSVRLPAVRIGFEAARLLDEWLSGSRPHNQALILPPAGVMVRQSSNLQAVSDSAVAAAVRFIHDHAHEPLQVSDVLRAVAMARRGLERRFRRWLQRSILEEIRRAHVIVAQRLLVATDLPMSQIATRSGLQSSRHLSIAFRKVMGLTPTAFRNQSRLKR